MQLLWFGTKVAKLHKSHEYTIWNTGHPFLGLNLENTFTSIVKMIMKSKIVTFTGFFNEYYYM